MSDWRLSGQEQYLSGATLYKVSFPAFWVIAYRDQNEFYQRIARYAERYVADTNRRHAYLAGDQIRHFWHEHCEFCWEKAMTDKACTFYCTEDMAYWICEECFRDFHEKFHWQEKPAEALFWEKSYE